MRKRLRKMLSEVLSEDELVYVYNSYDIVGDIAILRLTERAMKYSQIIAETIMGVHKNVKTVLAQTGPVCGDFRIRNLAYVAGENKLSLCIRNLDVYSCGC